MSSLPASILQFQIKKGVILSAQSTYIWTKLDLSRGLMCLTALEELCTVTVLASKPRGLLMLSYVPYDKKHW